MNPLVPAPLDIVLASVVTVHVILVAIALTVLIVRRQTAGLFGSLVLIVLVPVVGPALWLTWSRLVGGRARPSHSPS